MRLHVGDNLRHRLRPEEHKHHRRHDIVEIVLQMRRVQIIFERPHRQALRPRQLRHVLHRVRIVVDGGYVKTLQGEKQRVSALTAAHVQRLARGHDAFRRTHGGMGGAHAVFLAEIIVRRAVKLKLHFQIVAHRFDFVPLLRRYHPRAAFGRQFVFFLHRALFVQFVKFQTALRYRNVSPSTLGGIVFRQKRFRHRIFHPFRHLLVKVQLLSAHMFLLSSKEHLYYRRVRRDAIFQTARML